MSDRTLGYSVVIFCILFVLIPGAYLASTYYAPGHRRTIVFREANSLSFLQVQDEVRMQGMVAGEIRNLSWRNDTTFVEIETKKPLTLHQGYRLIAESKGFMGDRYLEIHPGDPNAPLIDASEMLVGTFPMGPTEAISYMRELESMIRDIIKFTDDMANGTPEQRPFVSQWNETTSQLDALSISLTTILKKTDSLISANAENLKTLLNNTNSFANELSSAIPETSKTLDSLIAKSERLLISTDTLCIRADSLIKKLDGEEIRSLAKQIVLLRKRMAKLRDAIRMIENEGMKLPVRLK